MATGYLKSKQKLRGVRSMLLAVTFINVLTVIVLKVVGSFFENSIPLCLEALITGFCAYVIPILIYAKFEKITASAAAEKFYLKPCDPKLVAVSLIMGLFFQFVMIGVNLPLNLLFNDAKSYTPASVTELATAMLVIGVIPAIFEEFLFRGIVYGSMAELNCRAAAIFSAFMFAVMHGDPLSMPGYILMGALLAVVVGRTNSLYSSMIFHFANNAAALLLGYFSDELIYAPSLTIKLFVMGILGFAAVFALFISLTKRKEPVRKIKTSVLLGQNFISVPIILCLIITVMAAVLSRML